MERSGTRVRAEEESAGAIRENRQSIIPAKKKKKKEPRPPLTEDSFEGHSRWLTVWVVVVAAILLVLVESEHSVFNSTKSGAPLLDIVINFSIMILVAVIVGTVATGALQANFRSRDEQGYGLFFIISLSCLILSNFLVGIAPFQSLKESGTGLQHISNASHYILAGFLWLAALLANIFFFKELFRPYHDHVTVRAPLPHERTRIRLERTAVTAGQPSMSSNQRKLVGVHKAMDAFMLKAFHASYWVSEHTIIYPYHLCIQSVKYTHKSIGGFWSSTQEYCVKTKCGKLWKVLLLKIGELNSYSRYPPKDAPVAYRSWQVVLLSFDQITWHVSTILGWMQSLWADLKEDVIEDDEFRHSSWMKSAVITSLVVLIYATSRTLGVLQWLVENEYEPKRSSVLDPDPIVRNSVDTFLRLLGFVPLNDATGNCLNDHSGQACVERFLSSETGAFVEYVDAVIIESKWTMYYGYCVGMMAGIYSLISVAGQYKRMIKALSFSTITQDLPAVHGQSESQRAHLAQLQTLQLHFSSWRSLIRIYPLGWTVYFFGILVSTTFLQLQIFGLFLTWALATLASLRKVVPFASFFGRVIFAVGLVWVVNNVFSRRIVANKLLTHNEQIRLPNVWILYTIVYTIVHIITGILFAVQRILFLISSSFLSIARLDKDVLQASILPFADAGHQAFMSMVLMHHAIKENSKDTEIVRHNSETETADTWDECEMRDEFSTSTLQMMTARNLAARIRSQPMGGKTVPNLAREHVSQIRMVKAASMKLHALANLQRRSVSSRGLHQTDSIRSYRSRGQVSQPVESDTEGRIDENNNRQQIQASRTSEQQPASIVSPSEPSAPQSVHDTIARLQMRNRELERRLHRLIRRS